LGTSAQLPLVRFRDLRATVASGSNWLRCAASSIRCSLIRRPCTPRQSNDRLLLGLKGSLNEYELDLLRQRSLEARREKAKRGELVVAAPVGYCKTEDQRLEKDPDLRVQDAIRSVFRQFGAIGSVRQTLLWFLEHGLQFPACTPRGEIQWKRPSYGTVYRILTNPIYGDAYAYGKTECTINYGGGEPRKRDRRKPRDEWLALIPNAHDGYVQWDEFERIQCAINGNLRQAGHACAPKNGEALPAGLLCCRRCASKLTLHYTGNRHDALRCSCHRPQTSITQHSGHTGRRERWAKQRSA